MGISKKLTKKLNKCLTLQEMIEVIDDCVELAHIYLSYGNYHAFYDKEDFNYIGSDFLSKYIKKYEIEKIEGSHAIGLRVVLKVWAL